MKGIWLCLPDLTMQTGQATGPGAVRLSLGLYLAGPLLLLGGCGPSDCISAQCLVDWL